MQIALWKPLSLPFEFALNLLMSLSYFGLGDVTRLRSAGVNSAFRLLSLGVQVERSRMMFWLKMLTFVQELKARRKKIPIRATFLWLPSCQMLEALFIHMYNDKHQKTTCNILPHLICNPRRRTSTTMIVEGTRVQKRSKVGILAG